MGEVCRQTIGNGRHYQGVQLNGQELETIFTYCNAHGCHSGFVGR